MRTGYRHLTANEISALEANRNRSSPPGWQGVFVGEGAEFNPDQVRDSEFAGVVYIGGVGRGKLTFHDLELEIGVYRSYIEDCEIASDVCVRNVAYLKNYRIGRGVILFNIQEMSCTNHSKFGNGWLKEKEPESNRIWIGVANENDKRAVLPFESMICADAWLWSRHREDKPLMSRLVELTERGNDRKLNTRGVVEERAVIKNTVLIKDAKIGAWAYVKGAMKLKNITILSSKEESSQIGEGVELVNGIMGYGSKVFYQAVAVRFVIGRNCQLKYGARLLNSVLGDNSTVSCCELLNNLIFPFHEQHHNTSFLIACTVMGQSNIAAGATIGSNHNSRGPDGEIIAGRGFWPGLCSDFKHNSRFASFTLVSKGSYRQELNIIYPFSLVSNDRPEDGSDSNAGWSDSNAGYAGAITIIPAYWFMYNMFAIARNRAKYKSRDKRAVKVQAIETDPLAPDTMQETLAALERIIALTASCLAPGTTLQQAKDYLHQHRDSNIVLWDREAQKKYGAKIVKAAQGYKEYRKIVKYYAVRCFMDYRAAGGKGDSLSPEIIQEIKAIPLFTDWENAGGQVIPAERVADLRQKITSGALSSWDDVHGFYAACEAEYPRWKARHALYLLETLYARPIDDFTEAIFADIKSDVRIVSDAIYESAFESRRKDYDDFFRRLTYRSDAEMEAVLGALSSNDFLCELKAETEDFNRRLEGWL
jgi:NDP-sugar pyrophosphorylase family protein